jgi:hypothetical protein
MNRSANHLLRMCLDGKIALATYPKGYFGTEDKWENHADLDGLQRLLGIEEASAAYGDEGGSSGDDSASEDEKSGDDADEEDEAPPPPKTANRFTALGGDGSDD